MNILARTALLAVTLTAGGCAFPPRLGAPPQMIDSRELATGNSLSVPEGAFPDSRWWTTLGDTGLSALIEEGLQNAPGLDIAAARMEAARAAAGNARAELWPKLSAIADAQAQNYSQNQTFPSDFIPDGTKYRSSLYADLRFDLDLWGRNRAALAAATSEAQAAAVDMEQARLMLSTGIAETYFELARLGAARRVAADYVEIMEQRHELSRQRYEKGLENLATPEADAALLARARVDLTSLDISIAATRHALAAMVGAGPDRGDRIAIPAIPDGRPVALPADLPVNLLGRRPDVAAARLRVEAAVQRERSAKAAYLPNINLAAVAGLQSIPFRKLFESDSTFANYGPALSLPLIDGGALGAQYRGARARQAEAVAHYDDILLSAYQQIADLIARKREMPRMIELAKIAAASTAKAYQVAQLRHGKGLSNRLELLDARNATLDARRALIELYGMNVQTDIALIRALGGGFDVAGPDKAGTGGDNDR